MKANLLIRRTVTLIVCCCMLITLGGCSKNQSIQYADSEQKEYILSEKHKIIIDTDTAADDAMAIVLMAKATNVELKGVTVLSGNVSLEQGCKNALMALEVADSGDVPVYCGSETDFYGTPIVPYSVFGVDGMGDQDLIQPTGNVQNGDGIDFIIETVKAEPGEIEIIATGPLTNIAKAIQRDPETMQKVKRIWSMGTGGVTCSGNASPVAEFNVYLDMLAYQYVLDSGIPMTIIGYDVCKLEDVSLTAERLDTLSSVGKCGLFLSEALSAFAESNLDGSGFVHVCDPVAAACIIWDNFVSESKCCDGDVVVNSGLASGEVIFYMEGTDYDMLEESFDYHIDLVTELNSDGYFQNICNLIR